MQLSDIFAIPIDYQDQSYDKYQITKQIIKKYSDQYQDRRRDARGTKDLAIKMGFNNPVSLYNRRAKYDNLEIPVHEDYFSALGVTDELLELGIESDNERFLDEISNPAKYRRCYLNIHKYIKQNLRFEDDLSELDAIEITKEILLEQPKSIKYAYLKRGDLYDIIITRKETKYVYYKPKMQYENHKYHFIHAPQIGLRI